MSSTPTPPVVPVPGDDGDDDERLGDEGVVSPLGDDDDQPLDPDLNDDLVNSAEADERAATEGELDGSEEE
ncbi:hypothetical protein [Pseudactinotalea terrae]|uniref:hypothetical protein n=1 Tax=Pseudactinotalea terrae TaxID=1743262 RepID=UPI0012E0E3A0|nr:hypothetical protein [Pseudactinotalea terrae]